jgi:hypothetical protein
MGINWRRGALRLWTVASVMWCALVVIVSSEQLNVAWPFASLEMVHVKFSDTETWDYPAVWGVARIEADLKRRIDDLNRKDREWLTKIPEARKAQCGPVATGRADSVLSDIDRALKGDLADEECNKIFSVTSGQLAVPSGWETQARDAPMSIWQAIGKLAPWAVGPPLLVMALGIALFWALAGFRRDC